MKAIRPTIPKLKRRADDAFSKYVRYRDSYLSDGERVADCITCRRPYPIKQIQAGHFISRAVSELRYDESNVNAQCIGCNIFKAGDQYNYGIALDLKFGDGTAHSLYHRRHTTHRFTRSELEDIIQQSNEQVASYQEQKV